MPLLDETSFASLRSLFGFRSGCRRSSVRGIPGETCPHRVRDAPGRDSRCSAPPIVSADWKTSRGNDTSNAAVQRASKPGPELRPAPPATPSQKGLVESFPATANSNADQAGTLDLNSATDCESRWELNSAQKLSRHLLQLVNQGKFDS